MAANLDQFDIVRLLTCCTHVLQARTAHDVNYVRLEEVRLALEMAVKYQTNPLAGWGIDLLLGDLMKCVTYELLYEQTARQRMTDAVMLGHRYRYEGHLSALLVKLDAMKGGNYGS